MSDDLDLIQRLAEARGERVIFVPPAMGGWEVIVGTTRGFRQKDIRTALHVTAQRLDEGCGPRAARCPLCGSVLHLDFGRLRCRACPVDEPPPTLPTGQGSTEEGGEG
jgi:hypothetical protein